MSRTLLEHQKEALFYMECNPSLAVYAEMGLGKTAIALTYIMKGMRTGTVKDVLVVCPASLVSSWRHEIEDMILFEGVTEKDIESLRTINITSFQKMYDNKRIPKSHKDGQVTYKRQLSLREEVDRHWDVLIIDESHSIGRHDSIQTRSAITLSKLSDRIYLLSGTPFHGPGGRPAYEKMYGQFQVLTKGRRWKNWSDFKKELVTSMDKWYNPRTFDEEKCKKIIMEHSVAYRLADCVDMPEYLEQDIPCELVEKKVYDDIKKGDVAKYGLDIEVGGAIGTKLLQVCSGSLKRETDTLMLSTSKDDVLKDLLEGTDEPVVIFCHFRASVDRCAEVTKKAHRKAMTYDGRSKKEAWRAFVDGKFDTIICQYQSGGVGLNLQRSHIMIFYEPTRFAVYLEQAKGRIYRKGQEQRCLYYYLVTPKTAETPALETVRSGMDLSDDMLEKIAHMEL